MPKGEAKPLGKKIPIYDQPNHRSYGPVRRMHLILMYLYSSSAELARREENFKTFATDMKWDWTEYADHLIHEVRIKEDIVADDILSKMRNMH